MRVRLPAVLSVLALAWVALAWAALPAIGAEEGRITVFEGETVVREYPPLPVSDPVRGEVEGGPIPPESCRDLEGACDVVPITVRAPAQPGEFLIRFTLFFEAEPVAPLLTAQSNDLDMYLWDDPSGEETIDIRSNEEDGARNPGASARVPERINFFTDQPGNYQIVITNWLSTAPVPYTLEVAYVSGSIERPFESLDPTATPRPSSGTTSSPSSGGAGTAGPSPSTDSGPAPTPVIEGPADGTVSLEPAPFDDDPDFAAIGGRDLESALAAPPERVVVPTRTIAAAQAPSGLVLALWFGLVPLLLLATAGWLLVRANPALVWAALPRRRQATATT
ncbi:MAG TPA: hypothetical protein VMN58_08325 [Acidimicrobiales bacterium]|nr:hypothetical protein [Acidimicrobiales bacterium]